MKWKTAVVSLLVLPWMWTACQREWLDPRDLKVVVSPGFQFPLAHVALDLQDVLPVDSTGPATLTSNPFYTLSYQEDSLVGLSVADLLELPSQSPVGLTANLGLVSLPNVFAATAVSLGTLSAQVSNPSTFGASMSAAHGSTAPFPPLPNQNPGALSTLSLGTIQTADFASGSMAMTLVNGFPAEMSLTVALVDAQGTEQLTFSFVNVAAGDSALSVQNMANKSLPGSMDVVLKNLSSPGAGIPGIPSTYVSIDTSAALALTASATGLNVRSATATTQTQTVVDSTLWMNFGVPMGVEITEIGFLSGQLGYTIQSGFPEDVLLTLSLPGSNVNGGAPWSQSLTLLKNSTIFGAFPWAGLNLDLSQDSAQPFNQLPLDYEVTLVSSNQPVTLDSSQAITFTWSMDNLVWDHVFGFFGQDSLAIPVDTLAMRFPALDRLQGSLVFAEPSLTLISTSQTSVGLPLTLAWEVASVKQDGTLEPLGGPVDPTFNAPVSLAMVGQNRIESLVYDRNNSNIVNMLSWPKTGFVYGGSVGWNQDTAAHGRLNYIHHTSQQQIGVAFTLPFAITASGLSFVDSVDVTDVTKQLRSDSTLAVAAALHIHSVSAFPLDAALHFRFYDAMGGLVWMDELPLVHSGVVDPQTGFVTAPTSATDILTWDALAMEQIAQAQWLEIEATLETTGGGIDPVKLQVTNGLELHLGMEVEFEKVFR